MTGVLQRLANGAFLMIGGLLMLDCCCEESSSSESSSSESSSSESSSSESSSSESSSSGSSSSEESSSAGGEPCGPYMLATVTDGPDAADLDRQTPGCEQLCRTAEGVPPDVTYVERFRTPNGEYVLSKQGEYHYTGVHVDDVGQYYKRTMSLQGNSDGTGNWRAHIGFVGPDCAYSFDDESVPVNSNCMPPEITVEWDTEGCGVYTAVITCEPYTP